MVAALCMLSSCTGAVSVGNAGGAKSNNTDNEIFSSIYPTFGHTVPQGRSTKIKYTLTTDKTVDSVVMSINNRKIAFVDSLGYNFKVDADHPTGRIIYKLTAYTGDDSTSRTGEFTVVAAQAPQTYNHIVQNVYPHATDAYTQGLLFDNGVLYESNGLIGESSLRKLELESGKILQNRDMPRDYFSEGLALLNGKLYMITYQNNKAIVFDKTSFEPLEEFTYSGDGWGLTTDGTNLYMSDGTEKIHIVDPKTFKRMRTLEVYTDKSKVNYINEMEWIDGEIWANIYTSDIIVRINPKTGAVTGVIDMSGLLSQRDITPDTDVLNGIAQDPKTGRIFVTGKNWNKLFEVKIVKK